MIPRDLWSSQGPTATELKMLERLSRRRRAIEATTPASEDEAWARTRALAILDEMEECLCEEGPGSRHLARAWDWLEQLEATPAPSPASAGPKPEAAHPSPGVVPIARRRTTMPSTRDAQRPATQGDPMNLTALETVRAVARHAAESPSPPDRSAESSARAAESSARVAESSVRAADTPDEPRRGFWRRIARVLWRLLAARAVDVRFARVATRAPVAFQPLFEIDGLPADPRAMPGLSTRAAARIDLLRQERASRAFVRPDRPPAAGPSATASSDRAIGFWDDLLDGISEALEIFIAIGDAVGAERLVEILELLMRIFPDQQPEAA